MSKLQFLHFDSNFRDNLSADPFSSTFTLANPLKKIKKVYLKSCEIPIGFFNIRTNFIFSFVITFPPGYIAAQVPGTGTFDNPIDLGAVTTPIVYQPYLKTVNPPSNYFGSTGSLESKQLTDNSFQFIINVLPGNYTIDTLIDFINNGLSTLYTNLITQFHLTSNVTINLSKLTTNDSGTFPVGYLKLSYDSGLTVNQFNSNFLTNTIMGFSSDQSDSTQSHIIANQFWGIYNDLSIYMYFPNIPHNNTHFSTQLVSFKIPMSSGYQSIQFSSENQNFANYIEVSDPHYILKTLQLQIYDTYGNPLNNQYNFNFTLGFETL
jgi:hypothetical protein